MNTTFADHNSGLISRMETLTKKVNEQFPNMMQDYKAEVQANIMHTAKLEASMQTSTENIMTQIQNIAKTS